MAPGGLQTIIKKSIFYKEYNITNYHNDHGKRINADITLRKKHFFLLIIKSLMSIE